MKRIFPLIVLGVAVILATTFCGCSVGVPGSPDPPPMPTQGDLDSLSGTWTGTWSSYSGSGDYGSLDPVEFVETENPEGGYILDGSITITGMEGLDQGDILGTRQDNSINFDATFPGGRVMSFSGNLSYGSITGSYTLNEDDEQLDAGSFFISKNP